MSTLFSRISPFLDLVYPPVCPRCEQEVSGSDSVVCERCWERLDRFVASSRPAPVDSPEVAAGGVPERNALPILSVFRLGLFESPLSELIRLFKYDGYTQVGGQMASLLAEVVRSESKRVGIERIDGIISVPLHFTAERKRGFNQAEIVSDILEMALNTPHLRNSAVRLRRTKDQTKLSPSERAKNMAGAFGIPAEAQAELVGLRILLVDDVITTGATVRELAKVVKDAGAQVVGVAALASALEALGPVGEAIHVQ